MGADSAGIIKIFPRKGIASQTTLDGGMIHEAGHIISQQRWGIDRTSLGWKQWKAAMQQDVLFASRYARKSPGEDFAETLVLYCIVPDEQQDELRHILSARFEIIDKIVSSKIK
jgi:hypothetical protein